MDARLGAAGDDRVGVAAADDLGALADRVRAGRAGGHGRVVRPAHAERDRELPRRGVHEHVREEVRRDTVVAALGEDRVLLDDPDDAADRGAEHDPDARRIGHLEARVGHRLLRRAERDQHVSLEPTRVLRPGDRRRVEALDLGRDPHREPRRVEGLDEVDPAPARDRRVPGGGRVEAERGDRAETGDCDSSHTPIVVTRHGRAGSARTCGPGRCPRAGSRRRPARARPRRR